MSLVRSFAFIASAFHQFINSVPTCGMKCTLSIKAGRNKSLFRLNLKVDLEARGQAVS